MKSQRMLSGVAALGGLVLLLGCGTQTSGRAAADAPTSPSQTSRSPASPGLTAAPDKPTTGTVITPPLKGKRVLPGDFAPEVVWRHDRLIVTAYGSSTCRPVADAAAVSGQHTIVVTFGSPPNGVACTDDYGPTRSRIPAPSGDIDLDSKVYAAFDLEGTPPQPIPVQLVNPVLN